MKAVERSENVLMMSIDSSQLKKKCSMLILEHFFFCCYTLQFEVFQYPKMS